MNIMTQATKTFVTGAEAVKAVCALSYSAQASIEATTGIATWWWEGGQPSTIEEWWDGQLRLRLRWALEEEAEGGKLSVVMLPPDLTWVKWRTNYASWEEAVWARLQFPIARYDMEGELLPQECWDGPTSLGQDVGWASRNVKVNISPCMGGVVVTVSNNSDPMFSSLAADAISAGWNVVSLEERDIVEKIEKAQRVLNALRSVKAEFQAPVDAVDAMEEWEDSILAKLRDAQLDFDEDDN